MRPTVNPAPEPPHEAQSHPHVLGARGYSGPVGIDALEHAPRPGAAPGLRPLVEVNARHTLGRVSLALAPLLPPGGCGCYRLASVAAAERAGALVVDAVGPGERGPVAVLLTAASREELLAREAALEG